MVTGSSICLSLHHMIHIDLYQCKITYLNPIQLCFPHRPIIRQNNLFKPNPCLIKIYFAYCFNTLNGKGYQIPRFVWLSIYNSHRSIPSYTLINTRIDTLH